MPTSWALKGFRSVVSVSTGHRLRGVGASHQLLHQALQLRSWVLGLTRAAALASRVVVEGLVTGSSCGWIRVRFWLIPQRQPWMVRPFAFLAVASSSRWAFAVSPPLEKAATKLGTWRSRLLSSRS